MADAKERIIKPSEEKAWEKYYTEDGKNFEFPKTNVFDAIYDENKNRKDDTALEYEGTVISFGELFDRVEERTEFFKKCGIKENEIVTISMLMSPDFVYNWYALGRIGAISNLIDPRTSVEGIREYIEEADSRFILNTNLFTPKLVKAVDKGDKFRVVNYSLGNYATKIEGPFGLVSGLMTLVSKKAEKNDYRFSNAKETPKPKEYDGNGESVYREDLPLTIVHTGGTTGFPKGVVLSHDNYNAMAYEYMKSHIGFTANDRFLLVMPPWISYGSGMLHMSLITGMKSTIISKLDSKKMDRYILKFKPQWFAGVPAHFKLIGDSKRIKDQKVHFLKAGAVGGDAMSSQLYNKVNDMLIDNGAKKGVYPGYALTEVTSAFAVKQLGEYKPGSVGIPLPGCTVGIFKFDEVKEETTDEELDYDKTGEICMRTPNMMLGYFKNEENTKNVLRKHSDGNIWVHTGDLGHIDKDGFLFVDGRIKEMITRYDGFKIYPSLIEKVIYSCDDVASCKVVGIDDIHHNQGQSPKAFIVFKQNDANTEQTINLIKKKCKAVLPSYYVENLEIEGIEKLPLTPIGKVDFNALKAREIEKRKILKK